MRLLLASLIVLGSLALPATALAGLNNPRGLAVSPQGDIYVADAGNNQVVKFSGSGQVEAVLGGLAHPEGVAVASDGSVYVADTYHNQVAVFSPQGTLEKTIGAYSFEPKPGSFDAPVAVAVSGQYLYVAGAGALIQRYSLSGSYLGSFGDYLLHRQRHSLSSPSSLTVDRKGRVYVADAGRHNIVVYGHKGSYLKTFSINGLDVPAGLALGDKGNLFVSDAYASSPVRANHERVLEWTGSKIARSWGVPCPTGCVYGRGGSQPGQLSGPQGIAVIGGTIYVADSGNNRIELFSLAGSFLGSFSG